MTADLYVLLALVFFTSTTLCLGDTFLRLLPASKWTASERAAIAFLVGAGLLSMIVLALSLAGLARRDVFIGFSVAVDVAYLWFTAGSALRGLLDRPIPLRSVLLFAPVLIFFLMYVVYALGPETSPDAMDYHLTFAGLYKRANRFVVIKDSYQAGFPQASEMIFLFCAVIADFRACALSHLLFLAATVPLFISFGRLIRNTSLGLVAGGLFLISPIVGIDASTAYNDVALASYGLGTAYVLTLWSRDRDMGTLILAGVLSGMAMAMKYTGVAAMAGGVMLICLTPRQLLLSRIRRCLVFAAAGAVPVLPWLVKNAWCYGNPFLPFANAWFPNPYIHVAWEIDYTKAMHTFNDVRWAEIPMEATVRGFRLTGFLGPIFLLSPLVFLSLRFKYAWHVFFWLVVWLMAYTANIGARFLIPVLPFACLGLASVVMMLPAAGWLIVYLHALLSWPGNTPLYSNQWAYRINSKDLVRGFAYDTQQEFLSIRDSYRAAKLLDENVPSEAVVFSFTGMDRAYTKRHVAFVHQSAKAQVVQDLLMRGLQPPENSAYLDCRFSEPAANIEISGESKGNWSMSELEAFGSDGANKPIRLSSSVNPWYLPYLRDGRLVTHWSTWGPVSSVKLKVQGTNVASVRLAFAGEQTETGWKVSGASSINSAVSTAVCAAGSQPIAEDLERTAIQSVKDLGVTHALLKTGDSYSAFFRPIIERHGKLIASEGYWLLFALQ